MSVYIYIYIYIHTPLSTLTDPAGERSFTAAAKAPAKRRNKGERMS